MSDWTQSPGFSRAELAALEQLASYGIDFGPVYIGRVRHLKPGLGDADAIVDEVIGLLELDRAQWEALERRIWEQTPFTPISVPPEELARFKVDQERFLERAKENRAIEALYDYVLSAPSAQAELGQWRALISEEVDRLRFNQGFEPVEFDLYPASGAQKRKLQFIGQGRIGHTTFRAMIFKALDSEARQIVHLSLRPQGAGS